MSQEQSSLSKQENSSVCRCDRILSLQHIASIYEAICRIVTTRRIEFEVKGFSGIVNKNVHTYVLISKGKMCLNLEYWKSYICGNSSQEQLT